MRLVIGITIFAACSGMAIGEPISLEGKTLTLESPEAMRNIPVKIADGVEGENYTAMSAAFSMPITVVAGEAWAMVPPGTEGTIQFSHVDNVELAADAPVKLVKRENADKIDVLIHGQPFTTYHYSNEDRKPYLWPVKAEGGVSVTRDYPMGEGGATKDHPHQVSFWTGYGDLNGHDYWEYGERTGWQRTESIEFGSGGACGWITTHIVWVDKDQNPVIDEHRTFRFYANQIVAPHRLFDVDIEFRATYGDVKFGDTKEGGIVAVRVADALRERGGSGTITTGAGAIGAPAAWGKPAAWCDYSGTIEGAGVRGLTVMDSPSSFRHPSHWHVRDYGLMGANPFGYSHFYDGEKNGDHTVKQGESLPFSYRIFVHSGDAAEADVAEHYQDFANPPVVTVK